MQCLFNLSEKPIAGKLVSSCGESSHYLWRYHYMKYDFCLRDTKTEEVFGSFPIGQLDGIDAEDRMTVLRDFIELVTSAQQII